MTFITLPSAPKPHAVRVYWERRIENSFKYSEIVWRDSARVTRSNKNMKIMVTKLKTCRFAPMCKSLTRQIKNCSHSLCKSFIDTAWYNFKKSTFFLYKLSAKDVKSVKKIAGLPTGHVTLLLCYDAVLNVIRFLIIHKIYNCRVIKECLLHVCMRAVRDRANPFCVSLHSRIIYFQ